MAIATVPRAFAQNLPDLGGSDRIELSPQAERRIGEAIVRDIRQSEPAYIDDPEILEYLNTLGARLTAVAPGARHDFEFFAIRDGSINAFALPGGYIGVHTGLVAATDSESELASVLAHEIAHVTQRHIARMYGAQQRIQLPVLAALAAALLLGRSRPDLAAGAAAAAQAGGVQAMINYTREFEREADRVGFQTLVASGLDPRGMASMFEKMQRSMRVSDDGTFPGYLRTHPMTTERMADAQSRAGESGLRRPPDSLEYHLVRAKILAESADPAEAVTYFASLLKERRYTSETAARYGLASALLRAKRFREVAPELAALRVSGAASPLVDLLAVRYARALGNRAEAHALLARARQAHPHRRSVVYAQVATLIDDSRPADAGAMLAEPLKLYPRDPQLLSLQSKTYAALGKRALQHQTQAEVYVLQGSLPAAIEQLQLAQAAGDGDFYQLSVIDARLRELRVRQADERRGGGFGP